jgi:spore maturation protein CgeB
MGRVLFIAGTQPTTSDLHLLFHRAFGRIGWESTFLSHDSALPFGEKVLQQARLRFSRAHFVLFNRRVRRVARTVRPDLVVVSGSNWYVEPNTIRYLRSRLGARVVLNEQHLQVFRRYQADALPLYDHVFTQDSALVSLLRNASPAKSVSLLGPACDPEEHRPLSMTPEDNARFGADVAYLGYAYANRIEAVEPLATLGLKIWGMGWEASPILDPLFDREPISGLKKTKVYNATRVNLNIQSVAYQLDGITCRPFEVAACGAFALCEARPDVHRFFRVGEEIATFSGAAELKDKVAYFLAHDAERREIASEGRRRVLAEHTYTHRAREIVAAVGLS